MKILALYIAFFAAVSVAFCQNSLRSYMQEANRQRSQVENLRAQFLDLCPGKSDEFDDAVLQLQDCVDEIDKDTETICSAMKNHYMRCSKPLVQLMENCLPEESKEVPNLLAQSINSVAGYLCKTDGEHIFELANGCVYKTSSYRSMRCERRVKTKLRQYGNKAPTKTDLCDFAQSMKPCLLNHLQDSCGNQITRESFMGIFEALVAPCKTSETNEIQGNDLVRNDVELLD